MKIKSVLLILMMVFAVACGGSTEPETATQPDVVEETSSEEVMDSGESSSYSVNTSDSSVVWTGAKAIGDSHTGGISIKSGNLVVKGGQLQSGEFVIDMTTITNEDAGGMADRLIGHLESDDFFGIATHPEAMLTINSAESTSGDEYAVKGDLTIKGITQPIEFTTTATESGGAINATANITIDRALFDVQFGSGSFFDNLGDDLINDEIDLVVTLAANN